MLIACKDETTMLGRQKSSLLVSGQLLFLG